MLLEGSGRVSPLCPGIFELVFAFAGVCRSQYTIGLRPNGRAVYLATVIAPHGTLRWPGPGEAGLLATGSVIGTNTVWNEQSVRRVAGRDWARIGSFDKAAHTLLRRLPNDDRLLVYTSARRTTTV